MGKLNKKVKHKIKMDLKIGMLILAVGILLTSSASANIASWAADALFASNFVKNAGLGFTAAVGVDVNTSIGGDKHTNIFFGDHKQNTVPYPWIDEEYGIVWGNYAYSGYAGYKYEATIEGIGFKGSDDQPFDGICDGGLHAHAWIKAWDKGVSVWCVSY